ncbi:MAG: ABC transporter [Terriglobia bacterium]|nr:MAG: ABC transporter [Terriglobia bacterium]
MAADTAVREHLIWLLEGGHAHPKFDDAVKGIPPDRIGMRPEGAPHSAWELLEHMRIAQNDILRFSVSADYVSPKWPEGYWPAVPAPAQPADWTKSVRAFRKDLAAFAGLVRDPAQNLHKKFPWGDGQTLMREALLIADHNSYHVGQLVLVRRLLGAWPE